MSFDNPTPFEKAREILRRRREVGLRNFDEHPEPEPRAERCNACGQDVFVRRVVTYGTESPTLPHYREIASLHFARCGVLCAGGAYPAELPPRAPREGFHAVALDDDWTDGCSKCGHPDEERP